MVVGESIIEDQLKLPKIVILLTNLTLIKNLIHGEDS